MFQGAWCKWHGHCRCEHRRCGCEVCQHGLRGAWGANAGVESMNGAIHDAGMGIDSLGGAVDGARGKVNNAHMFRGTLRPRTCECGDTIHQRGLHLLWVHRLAVPQYEKGECSVFLRWSFKTKTKMTPQVCFFNYCFYFSFISKIFLNIIPYKTINTPSNKW